MINNRKVNLSSTNAGATVYQLKVEGNLDKQRISEMTGMNISEETDGRFWTLTGLVQDQSALNGLINTLYHMRLSVISIIRVSENT
jgi:hypothetical protein